MSMPTPNPHLAKPTEEALERICDAHWNGGQGHGVRFTDIHQHNACNHTLSGVIEINGIEYGFIIDNGNWNGTVVREWGFADDVGSYEPPPPPEPITFVPITRCLSPAMLGVYMSWREQPWFKEMERGYNYDRHFAPGGATERYYTDWAKKKGMKPGYKSEIPKEGVDPAELKALISAWEAA